LTKVVKFLVDGYEMRLHGTRKVQNIRHNVDV
jgi:hypothetical protein